MSPKRGLRSSDSFFVSSSTKGSQERPHTLIPERGKREGKANFDHGAGYHECLGQVASRVERLLTNPHPLANFITHALGHGLETQSEGR